MQLGSILDGAKHRPAVVELVHFKIIAQNAQAQAVTLETRAALSFVDEETRQEVLVESQEAIRLRFTDDKTKALRPVPREVEEAERAYHFLARALRDETDPAKPFATVDQLRPALVRAVATRLMDLYDKFEEREFNPAPPSEDLQKLKEQAAGK